MELRCIKYKQNTLFWIFLRKLFLCGIYILTLIFTYVFLFNMGLNTGIILPANYAPNMLDQNYEQIAKSEPFEKSLIPFTCYYGLYDLDKNYTDGNYDEKLKNEGKAFLENPKLVKGRYYCVDRKDGYCVIKYDISAHFAYPALHKLFPNLEFILVVSFIIFFITIIILTALNFGKNLKKELRPLLEQVEQIEKKELEGETNYCRVREFNEVLLSMNHMKKELAQSLKKQWEIEQERKFHISALAHDIKTPLTIIKGNAELIREENNLLEIHNYAESINNSTDKIEKYTKLLIDVTKNNSALICNVEEIKIEAFIYKIILESEKLCKTKNITLSYEKLNSDLSISMDRELITRAILNIVKNAVDYSLPNKNVKMIFSCTSGVFSVEVEDFGPGFSDEALKKAKEQFYTEKKERSEEHYGLGLYIADSIAQNNGGGMEIYNKPKQSGAIVRFVIKFK